MVFRLKDGCPPRASCGCAEAMIEGLSEGDRCTQIKVNDKWLR